MQAAVGALTGGFALNNLHDPPLAIAAALGAGLLLTGAVHGWCPASLLARVSGTAPKENTLGIPEVRQPFDPPSPH